MLFTILGILIGAIIAYFIILIIEIRELELDLRLANANKQYYLRRKSELEGRLKELEDKFEYDLLHKTNVEYKMVNLQLVRGEYCGHRYWHNKKVT